MQNKPLEYYLDLKYPVTLYADESGGYVAEIKDLPGCITQGETLEELEENINDARVLWLETAYENGCGIAETDCTKDTFILATRIPLGDLNAWLSKGRKKIIEWPRGGFHFN